MITGKVEFSDSWFTSLGYALDDLPRTVSTWKKLVHPDDLSKAYSAIKKCLDGSTEDGYRLINRLKSKDGSYRWNLDRGKVMKRDSSGKPIVISGAYYPLKLKEDRKAC